MKITVKYFALLREAVGVSEEALEIPADAATVGSVMQIVSGRHEKAFSSLKRIRAAVNETMAPMGQPLSDGDVVAFFPPVTGG